MLSNMGRKVLEEATRFFFKKKPSAHGPAADKKDMNGGNKPTAEENKMIKLTTMETAFLKFVIESDYNAGSGVFGEECIQNDVWTFCPVDNFGEAFGKEKTSGVVSSLVKKGAVRQGFHDEEGDITAITREGYDALVATGYVPED